LLVPARSVIKPADAAARLAHHLAGAEAAFADLYPQGEIFQWGNHNGDGDANLRGRLASGELSGALVLQFRTAPPPDAPEHMRELIERFERRRRQQ
jgi:hypothetical protein